MYFILTLTSVLWTVINCQTCTIYNDTNLDIEQYKDCCNASITNALYLNNEYFNPIKCYIYIENLVLNDRSQSVDYRNNYDRIYIDHVKAHSDLIIYKPKIFGNLKLFKSKPEFIIITEEMMNQQFVNLVERAYGLKVKGFYFTCVTEFILTSKVEFYKIMNFKILINNEKFTIADNNTIYLV